MSYSQYRYTLSDITFSRVTKEQNEEIDALTRISDFLPATYDKGTRTITFTGFDEYDTIKRFFKKLVKIKSDIHDVVVVEDSEEDTYWIVKISGIDLVEMFGTVYWGAKEDKAKIKAVLEAHLQTTDAKMAEIVDQISLAIKGGYDDLEDIDEEDVESLEDIEEPSNEDLADIEEEDFPKGQ